MSESAFLVSGVPMPQTWRTPVEDATGDTAMPWWNQFADAALDDFVAAGLHENNDVRLASARLEETVGRYQVATGARLAQLNVTGGRTRQRDSRSVPASLLVEPHTDRLQLQSGISWELDLFGKLRAASAAARDDILSAQHARRAVVLSLVAGIANGYVNLRNADTQLEITRETLAARTKAFSVFTARYRSGAISELEWNQSKAEFESVAASVPALERAVAQQENALSVLLGRNPGELPRGKALAALTVPTVPAGLPSSLLLRRPDLAQFEADIAAANARVDEARRAYLPDISITGAYGVASQALDALFKGPSKAWSWGAALTMPIFKGGELDGQLLQARAQREGALIKYRSAVQNALRETEDALVAGVTLQKQLDALTRQVAAHDRAAKLARLRYENGSTGFLDVLDAERNLYSARLNQAQVRSDLLQARVNLYKALGGAWVNDAEHKALGGQ